MAVDDERPEQGGIPVGYSRTARDEPLSLLWPPGAPGRQEQGRLSPETIADLDLDR